MTDKLCGRLPTDSMHNGWGHFRWGSCTNQRS